MQSAPCVHTNRRCLWVISAWERFGDVQTLLSCVDVALQTFQTDTEQTISRHNKDTAPPFARHESEADTERRLCSELLKKEKCNYSSHLQATCTSRWRRLHPPWLRCICSPLSESKYHTLIMQRVLVLKFRLGWAANNGAAADSGGRGLHLHLIPNSKWGSDLLVVPKRIKIITALVTPLCCLCERCLFLKKIWTFCWKMNYGENLKINCTESRRAPLSVGALKFHVEKNILWNTAEVLHQLRNRGLVSALPLVHGIPKSVSLNLTILFSDFREQKSASPLDLWVMICCFSHRVGS